MAEKPKGEDKGKEKKAPPASFWDDNKMLLLVLGIFLAYLFVTSPAPEKKTIPSSTATTDLYFR